MENIELNIRNIEAEINSICRKIGRPEGDVLLCAVTKTRSPEEINKAIQAGITDIGENKVQEILDKYDAVNNNVNWHMIGHLQTNKVKYIIDKVKMIHSVDSLKLAKEIDNRAVQNGIVMDILIQVNPANEESKSGVASEETENLISGILGKCENIRIRGLMTIAPFAEDPEEIRMYFKKVKELYDRFSDIEDKKLDLRYLSMGMSHDFRVAVEEGANIVRIGSAIFGERDYSV